LAECTPSIIKSLRKMIQEEGISGYSIHDGEIIIYVENESIAKSITMKELHGMKVKIEVKGRFVAL